MVLRTVHITRGAFYGSIVAMFQSKGFTVVEDVDNADVLALAGGADINPRLYGETPLAGTWFSEDRDAAEIDAYNRAVAKGAFIFGICRGGQLANVLNGGRLWQHIEGHPSSHSIVDLKTGTSIMASSIHHQMFRPGPDAEIVATCNHATFKVAEHDQWTSKADSVDDDVEVCWYPKTRSLCIQGHPEVGPTGFTDYCFDLMKRYA